MNLLMTNIWLPTFANTLGVTKISLRETSKLLEESRKIAEHETEDDSSEIKDAITSVVARVGDLVDWLIYCV